MIQRTLSNLLSILLFFIFAASIVSVQGYSSSLAPEAVPTWSDNLGNSSTVMVACSGNCSFIAAGTWNSNIVRMYDRTGKTLWTYDAGNLYVMDVAISGDGGTVAAGFYNPIEPNQLGGGEIVCFNRTGSVLWRYGTKATVHRIAVSDNGSRIFASGNSDLYFFDRNGTMLSRNDTGGLVWSLALSGDGVLGVGGTGYPKGGVHAMHPYGNQTLAYPAGPRLDSVAVSRDGSAYAAMDYKTLYYFAGNGTLLWNVTRDASYPTISLSDTGDYLVLSSQYSLWYFNSSGKLLWTYKDPGVVNSALTGSGDLVFASGGNGIYLFDSTGKILWRDTTSSASSLSAAENGEYFAAGTESEILFFNRDGSAMFPPSPVEIQVNATTALPTPPKSPSDISSPVSVEAILSGVACACGIVFLKRRNPEE